MKKKMLMFRNQLLILGFGSLMIVSCSKEDLDDLFGGDKNCRKDTTVVDNGSSCLTCGNDSMVDIGDTTIYEDPKEGGGGQQDSVVLIVCPIDDENGNECYDKSLIDATIMIPQVWKPVCGCDGVTYFNDMDARFTHGVKNYTDGPCQIYDKNDECYDKSLIIPTYVGYPEVWKPVCGCDGVTYSSDEEARFIYGVKNYTDGPCKNYDKNKDSEEDGLVFTY